MHVSGERERNVSELIHNINGHGDVQRSQA